MSSPQMHSSEPLAARALRACLWLIWTLAFVLAGLEVALRVFPIMPDSDPLLYRAIEGDEALGMVPGTEVRSPSGIAYRINALGLRSPESSVEKPHGVVRVAVLGDSVVLGLGVQEEDGLVPQLERRLNQRGRMYEVWNLGVSATNLFNYKARYARLAPLLRPDVTVVMVLYNDLATRVSAFRVTSLSTLAHRDRHAPFPDSWRPVLERSALYRSAIVLLHRFELTRSKSLEHYSVIESQLGEIQSMAAQLGSEMVLAVMADRESSAPQHAALSAKLAAFAERNGLPFIDLAGVLGNPGSPDLLLPHDPVHPNAAGHARIADALATAIP